jgi:hypothetical protein
VILEVIVVFLIRGNTQDADCLSSVGGDGEVAAGVYNSQVSHGSQEVDNDRVAQCEEGRHCQPGVPTEDAIAGGSYSTEISSTPVGPEGGQILVERSVEAINALWPEAK